MRRWLLLGLLAACGGDGDTQVVPASVTPDAGVEGTNPASGGPARDRVPARQPTLRTTQS